MFTSPQARLVGRAEASVILALMGLALLLVYLLTVLSVAMPPALLMPEWQLRVAGSLRGGASFPVQAVALILIAHRLNPSSLKLSRSVAWLRSLALVPALGFLLLAPLQLAAGYSQLNQARNQEQQVISKLSSVTSAISAARNAAEFSAAVAQLPGAPPLQTPPDENFEGNRRLLLNQLEPQIRQLRSQVEANRSGQLGRALMIGLRDALISFIYGLAFSALAQLPGGRFSLLSDLLHWGDTVFISGPRELWERASEAVGELLNRGSGRY